MSIFVSLVAVSTVEERILPYGIREITHRRNGPLQTAVLLLGRVEPPGQERFLFLDAVMRGVPIQMLGVEVSPITRLHRSLGQGNDAQ